MGNDVIKSIQGHIKTPKHIHECADAVYSDLMFGPHYAHVPDGDIEKFVCDEHASGYTSVDELPEPWGPVYAGPVGDALRVFIDDLPTLYLDEDDCLSEGEPTGWWEECPECGAAPNDDCPECDGAGEIWIHPPAYRELGRKEIVEALFGATIAREFR